MDWTKRRRSMLSLPNRYGDGNTVIDCDMRNADSFVRDSSLYISQWRSQAPGAGVWQTTYASDFSAGVDGWTAGAGSADGNIDSIAGEDNCLRFTSDATTAGHILFKNLTTQYNIYKLSLRCYIPSGNTTLKKVYIYQGATIKILDVLTTDSWVTATVIFVSTAVDFRIFGINAAGQTVYAGTAGDVFYIKDVVVERLSGNHLTQPTAAAQPLFKSDGVYFNGVEDFLKTAAFTLPQPVTVYLVCRQDSWTDTDYLFASNLAFENLLMQKTPSPELFLSSNGTQAVRTSTTVLGAQSIIYCSIDNPTLKIQVNNNTIVSASSGSTPAWNGFTLGSNANGLSCSNITVQRVIVRSAADSQETIEDFKRYLTYAHQVPIAASTMQLVMEFDNIAASTSNIRIDKTGTNAVVDWGDGTIESVSKTAYTAHTYAAPYTGKVRLYKTDGNGFTYIYSNDNKYSFNLNILPSTLTYVEISGSNTISGALSSLPAGVTYISISGSNTISGSLSGLPAGVTIMAIAGSNTVSGLLSNLPAGVTTVLITGSNTVSGALSSLPAGVTFARIEGSNTVSGSLSSLPAGVTYIIITGSNTISDYTAGHVFSASMNYFRVQPTGAGGLDATEIDNLIIDLDAVAWAGSSKTLTLTGTNAAPTAASAAAIASLTGKGVTVTTN